MKRFPRRSNSCLWQKHFSSLTGGVTLWSSVGEVGYVREKRRAGGIFFKMSSLSSIAAHPNEDEIKKRL